MKKYFIFKITAVAKTEIDRGGDFFYNTYKTKEGGQAMKEPEKNPGFLPCTFMMAEPALEQVSPERADTIIRVWKLTRITQATFLR